MQPSFLQALLCLSTGVTLIVVLTTRYRVHAFFALLLSCLVVGLGVGFPLNDVVATAKDGFGNIMKSLGLIIVLGTTLGVVLEYTGSTRVMAAYILKKIGPRRAAAAISLTGFIVGLPIFCDSGFIVLSGLNQSLAKSSRIPMAVIAVSLATGLYSVHCLIPPHPGAAAAAGTMGVDFGRLIVAGVLVAIPAAVIGHCWARYAGRNGMSAESLVPSTQPATASGTPPTPLTANQDDHPTPQTASQEISPFRAFLPVITPILLIALKSFFLVEHTTGLRWLSIFLSLGDPVIALLTGVLLAFTGGRSWNRIVIGRLLNDSVEKAGSILVIIGAGGAFGAILAATKMGEQLSAHLPLAGMGIFFPFLLTFLLKTAQGSSTVAIITAASIVKPLLPALGLASGNGPLLCILSMGAGSMMISHANDAYFWVIARFSGLDMRTMLKVYSMATLFMGLTAYGTVYLFSRFLS
ncbi:GntP family permease [Puia sp.]|jgi:GntP family gluconate:H+ symporter|uniref:GntP family permease n=1 Tax=Puia sp. TaxID=2045100 RepID=UPI002F42CC1A